MKIIFLLICACVLGFQLEAQVSFSLSSSPTVGSEPYSVAAADVNGDGKMDLICANNSGNSLTVLTNNGSGGFVLSDTYSNINQPIFVKAADVNGDGKVDIVAVTYLSQLFVLTNTGSGHFVTEYTTTLSGHLYSVATGDVNGDGLVDLVCGNNGNNVFVLTNNGNIGFGLNATYSPGNSPSSVALADVNGDGKLDLISANFNDNTLSVLTNNGSGGFVNAGIYAVGAAPVQVTAADVNGDGKPDLISANNNGNSLSVLTNNGSGGFATSGTYAVGSEPVSVTAADVNGDGKVDLISANWADSTLSVLTNNGSGGFATAGTYAVGSGPYYMTAADVNGDGKVDLICPNSGGNTLSVLTNATPFPPNTIPIITAQPVGITNLVGASASFNVGVTAQGTQTARQFNYKWQFNGTNLPAATNNPLVLPNLTTNRSGNYDVVIANSVGSVTSSPAKLDVRFILVEVNGQPAAATMSALAPITVTITGGYPGGFFFYTLDGSTPNTSSTLYTGPITLTNSAVVSVMGLSSDFTQTNFASPVTVQVIPVYNLQTSVVGAGTITVNPTNGPYASNTMVTLTATAAQYWAFSHWTGDAGGTSNVVNVTMNGPRNVQAVFVQAYPLTLSSPGGGGVTANGVVISPATYYPTGSVVTLAATASNGWSFVGWQGSTNSTSNPLSLTISQANIIQAIFGTVVGTNTAGGGSIVLSQTNPVPYGTIVTASAVPAPGKYFVTWSGAASGTNAPTTITVTNATPTINALFTTLPGGKYSLSVVVNGNGSVMISPQQNYYNPGDSVMLTPAANAGNAFSGWAGDAAGMNNPLTVVMNTNKNVLAYFTPLPPPIIPVITGFSPAAATNGASVIISGTNFSSVAANDTVYFGAVQASVTAASVTNLTVTVPVGATYAPITVTVNGLTAYADQPFMPTFPGIGQIDSSSLGPQVVLPAGNGPVKVVIADLDGDGKPDLVVANTYGHSISIFRNISTNGSLTAASFAPPVNLATPSGNQSPYYVEVADVDGDGKLDIIASDYGDNLVSVYRNTCTPGNISSNGFATRLDLVTGSIPIGIAVRDIDGDGKPEIVTANAGDNTISVFQNMSTVGNIAFAARVNFPVGNGPEGVAIGDLDGDGKPDVAVANFNDGTVSLLRNISSPGNIAFAPTVNFSTGSNPVDVALVDLDGDGKLDLAVACYLSQTFSVFRNISTAGSLTTNSLAPRIDFPLGGRGHDTAIGDLDGDGKPDLAVVTEINSLLSIFKNVSTPGSFTNSSLANRVDFSTGVNAWGVAVGDLDGDGRPDVVFANSNDNTISIYQNQVPFAEPPVITSQPTNQTVFVGGTATFSVTVSNTILLSYQWSFNTTNIVGATNATLTLTNVFPVSAGPYSVTIADTYGSITSNPAMLMVLPPGISGPAILANGQFQFSFNTTTGVNYEVEYSTDLINWQTLLTVSGNGLPSTFNDPNTSASPQRFYRIILSPQ